MMYKLLSVRRAKLEANQFWVLTTTSAMFLLLLLVGTLPLEASIRPQIIAHRGDSSCAPENTLAAFDGAVRAGADWVELDVHLSRDDQLVVIHDETVDRTTNGRGRVADHTLAELKALDAGAWFGRAFTGERIPTLAEALEHMRGRARVLVDLKDVESVRPGCGRSDTLVAHAIQAVEVTGMTRQVRFHTFYPDNLAALDRLCPPIPYALLYASGERTSLVQIYARRQGASGFHPHFQHLSGASVSLAHHLGMTVWTYTLDDEIEFTRALEQGVDGIITNRPAALHAYVAPVSASSGAN